MAFIVEDGTNVAGANSTVSLAFILDYLTDRGRQAENGWDTLTQASQEANAIAATDYLEFRYSSRLGGAREFLEDGAVQSLSFPRVGLYTCDGVELTGIPLDWQKAAAEYAVRAAAGPLQPDPPAGTGASVKKRRRKAGEVESETEYTSGTIFSGIKSYPAADALVRPLLAAGAGVAGVIR